MHLIFLCRAWPRRWSEAHAEGLWKGLAGSSVVGPAQHRQVAWWMRTVKIMGWANLLKGWVRTGSGLSQTGYLSAACTCFPWIQNAFFTQKLVGEHTSQGEAGEPRATLPSKNNSKSRAGWIGSLVNRKSEQHYSDTHKIDKPIKVTSTHRVTKSQTRLSDWTELNTLSCPFFAIKCQTHRAVFQMRPTRNFRLWGFNCWWAFMMIFFFLVLSVPGIHWVPQIPNIM